jgi:hypothetical protein
MRDDDQPYHGEAFDFSESDIAPALIPDAGTCGIDYSGDISVDDALVVAFYFEEADLVIPVYLPLESARELARDIIEEVDLYVANAEASK